VIFFRITKFFYDFSQTLIFYDESRAGIFENDLTLLIFFESPKCGGYFLLSLQKVRCCPESLKRKDPKIKKNVHRMAE